MASLLQMQSVKIVRVKKIKIVKKLTKIDIWSVFLAGSLPSNPFTCIIKLPILGSLFCHQSVLWFSGLLTKYQDQKKKMTHRFWRLFWTLTVGSPTMIRWELPERISSYWLWTCTDLSFLFKMPGLYWDKQLTWSLAPRHLTRMMQACNK